MGPLSPGAEYGSREKFSLWQLQTFPIRTMNMKDRLGWLLMAPFIIGPIVELGLRLSDGTWHLNAFWVFLLSAMGWLWVWWVVKSGLWPGEGKASVQGF